MILAILPEILLLVLAGVILAVDMIVPAGRRKGLGWLAAAGLAVILVGDPDLRPAGCLPRA